MVIGKEYTLRLKSVRQMGLLQTISNNHKGLQWLQMVASNIEKALWGTIDSR